MSQHILTVARSKLHSPHQVHQFFVQPNDVRFVAGFQPELANVSVHFLFGFVDNFFDPSRMNSAIFDQLDQRQASDFSTHLVER